MADLNLNSKVSVIIPTYNSAKYLKEAITSVICQTYSNIEIIVIDDGSTDNMKEVVASFGDRIHYRYQENCGAAAARNHGLKLTQGNYIAFLDADDVWKPEKIQKHVNYLYSHPDIAMVLTDMEFINEDGKTTGFYKRRKAYPHDGMILPQVFIRPFPFPSTMLVRKSIFT